MLVSKLVVKSVRAKQRTLFDNLEFVKSTYFKKEPSLMRKLLSAHLTFSALSHLGTLHPHAR